jgi:pyridoxal phosphate enzyme (YggS family)
MIAENYKIVEEKISEICLKSGRRREEIKLIAVSKTKPISEIEEAYKTGFTDFGENKAQELRDKASQFSGNFNWHFIGHLQTNKVKYVIEPSEYIHSVDSIKLAEEINKRAEKLNKQQKILLEINSAKEASKFGLVDEKEILEVAVHCKYLEHVDLKGVMTMAPFTNDKDVIRNSFVKLRKVFENLNKRNFNLEELSMGMTNDYEIAIEEGSTMLRIGTAIFGERNY